MTFHRNTNSRLVYSTEQSEPRCPLCGESVNLCEGHSNYAKSSKDGIVIIRREVKGRKGKTVTTISGLSLTIDEMEEMASDIKRYCSTGGSVKESVVVIQGDHRQKIMAWLEQKGFKVKLGGG